MPLRVKKSTTTSRPDTLRLRNNHGQAVIEYTLMLVISVSFVLALSMQIFKPFGEFISNYMGKYVGCLLEYGELPTLGSELPSGPDDDSECNKKFAPASATNGRPPRDSRGDSGEGNSSNSKSSASASNSSDSKDGTSSSEGSSGTHAGSASRGGGNNIMYNRRPSTGIDGGSGGGPSGKVIEIALDGGGTSTFFKTSSGGGYGRQVEKSRYIPISGLTEAEKKKIQKKAEGGARLSVSSEGLGPAPKKTAVKKPEVKTVIPEDEPLTIGNFMRYLLIAAIIIALIVFLGGQALQMSKSFEK